jgi:hypothetical protein
MSETTKLYCRRHQARYHLLATVSSAAILASVTMAWEANAAEDGQPTVWIEVGGALDQMDASDTRWSPPNLTPPISNPPPSPFGKLPAIGYDEDLKISFTPNESDWSFSASVRYGRAAHGPRHSHDQSYKFNIQTQSGAPIKYNPTNLDFANAVQKSRSTHAILDFQAGKDIGLGMFGGKSVFSAGVRVVKLNESAQGHLTAFLSAPAKYPPPQEVVHKADFVVSHSFNGIGPSVSWDGAAPFAGTLSEGFSFDWGANAAILFGRQKTSVALRTKDTRYYVGHGYPLYTSGTTKVLSQSTETPLREKTVIVPNLGGFAGLSWRLSRAKVSIGYRADFFFGAIDGGLAASQKDTRGFYGPFATVSVGIGG